MAAGMRKPPISKQQLDDMLKRQQIERDARELKIQADMARIEQMNEIKRREIERRIMFAPTNPTSSIIDNNRYKNPHTHNPIFDTKTPRGHKPESFVQNVGEIKNTKLEPEQHTPHVVPTSGIKHHIEVSELSHTIAPKRKAIIELVYDAVLDQLKKHVVYGAVLNLFKNKTRSSGPK